MRRFLPTLVVLLACCAPAAAQVVQPPERPSRPLFGGGPPPDPNRLHQYLAAEWDVLGGYDDNLAPAGANGTLAFNRPSGYLGFSDASLDYSLANTDRAFDASGRAYVNSYRNVGLTPSYGGELHLSGHTAVGRSNELRGSARATYDPYFMLQFFGSPAGDAAASDSGVNVTNALHEARSLAEDASVGLTHRWRHHAQLDAQYTFSNRTYSTGDAFDSRLQGASLGLTTPLTRRVSLTTTYRASDGNYVQGTGLARQLIDQGGEMGLAYARDLSPTRKLSLSGGGGAIHENGTLDTTSGEPQRFAYWAPSGYATAEFDFHRSWSLAADYRRTLSVLQGVTPDSFLADNGTLSLGGYLARRLEFVFDAGYSRARAGYTRGGDTGRYRSYSGTAQLRLALTRAWSALVSVERYEYALNDVAQTALGLPAQMHRNAVRIGFVWQQPLVGYSSNKTPQRPAAAGK